MEADYGGCFRPNVLYPFIPDKSDAFSSFSHVKMGIILNDDFSRFFAPQFPAIFWIHHVRSVLISNPLPAMRCLHSKDPIEAQVQLFTAPNIQFYQSSIIQQSRHPFLFGSCIRCLVSKRLLKRYPHRLVTHHLNNPTSLISPL